MSPVPSPLQNKLLCVAPMMAWTDRHCRYLHRLYAPSALLFTEMVTTGALTHGRQTQLLDYSQAEHPIALQLGGSDHLALAACTRLADARGFDEINLNVGCPSDRVRKGTFGACLMAQPQRVADCVKAMQDAANVPVTVKCRLGIDGHGHEAFLDRFLSALVRIGCKRVYLHARIAILGGLSPAQNRSVPPLLPERAERAKRDFPELEIIMNGGITDVQTGLQHLAWADGIMLGRAAYHQPDLLQELHGRMYGAPVRSKAALLKAYRGYAMGELAQGARLHSLTRHILSSCAGLPGARRFRQILSDHRRLKNNEISLLDEAIATVFGRGLETE